MKLGDYKLIFVAVALIGVLLIATPAIAGAIHLPGGEQFSELYLLGPDQMAQNYPSSITADHNYSVYVNVGNHLGSSAYYVLYVKLGNATDQLPNNTLERQVLFSPLYEYHFSIQDSKNWQSLLTFSVSDTSIRGTNSQINILQVKSATFNVNKLSL